MNNIKDLLNNPEVEKLMFEYGVQLYSDNPNDFDTFISNLKSIKQ